MTGKIGNRVIVVTFILIMATCIHMPCWAEFHTIESNTAQQYADLSWTYRDVDWDSSKHYALLAIRTGINSQQYKWVAYAINDLAGYYQFHAEYERAETLLTISLYLRKIGRVPEEIASGYNQLGLLSDRRGAYQLAIKYFKLAMRVIDKSENFNLKAKILDNMGVTYRNIGDLASSLKVQENSLKLMHAVGDEGALARSYQNLGLLFQQTHRLERAIEYYEVALVKYRSLGMNKDLALLLENIAMVHRESNKPEQALACLRESQSLHKLLGDTMAMLNTYNNMALVYMDLDQPREAELYFRRELEHTGTDTLKTLYAITALNMAELMVSQGRHREGLVYTDKASSVSILPPEYRARLYEIRASAYQGMDRFEESLKWQGRQIRLQDSLMTSMSELQNLSDKYLKEKERSEKATLEAANNEARLRLVYSEARSRNLQTYGLLTISLMIIVGLFLFLRSQRLRLKVLATEVKLAHERQIRTAQSEEIQNLLRDAEVNALRISMISQERERIRIAKDLHDRVGSKLSVVQMLFQSIQPDTGILQERLKMKYEKALVHLDEACSEVRDVARAMHSGELAQYGFQLALERFCEQIQSSGRFEVKFQLMGTPIRLPQSIENDLHDLTRTLMNNVLQHSRATICGILLEYHPTYLKLTVYDNGRGFDPVSLQEHHGIGLISARDRAKALGASFEISSVPGQGTQATICMEID